MKRRNRSSKTSVKVRACIESLGLPNAHFDPARGILRLEWPNQPGAWLEVEIPGSSAENPQFPVLEWMQEAEIKSLTWEPDEAASESTPA